MTGYLRATQFGKGWEFYAHEPIFWLKLTLLAVAGAASPLLASPRLASALLFPLLSATRLFLEG